MVSRSMRFVCVRCRAVALRPCRRHPCQDIVVSARWRPPRGGDDAAWRRIARGELLWDRRAVQRAEVRRARRRDRYLEVMRARRRDQRLAAR
ncbi:hypothetical protein [Isoptericola croceus]|uniref:hypothetical protein n=1 Tax=Isoptericola croceus TaxID=3031406 RepID=UPI0023FA405B|nr:hypothetical protein [Isoptericola croceus]